MNNSELTSRKIEGARVLSRDQLKKLTGGLDDCGANCYDLPISQQCLGGHPGCCPDHYTCEYGAGGWWCV